MLIRGKEGWRIAGALLGENWFARLKSVSVGPGAYAIGRSLGELQLEGYGARISAVRRRSRRGLIVAPELLVEADDVVVMLGMPEVLTKCEERLLRG